VNIARNDKKIINTDRRDFNKSIDMGPPSKERGRETLPLNS
jgi:hypothetical protein